MWAPSGRRFCFECFWSVVCWRNTVALFDEIYIVSGEFFFAGANMAGDNDGDGDGDDGTVVMKKMMVVMMMMTRIDGRY